MLDQLAAVAVHDRLRQPGRARREQHVDRVVERRPARTRAARPRRSARPTRPRPGRRLAERDPDHVLDRRDPAPDRLDLRPAVDVAVAEAVAADGDQHAWLDLREPIDHAAGAELGRTRGPDRAEARGRDERRSASRGCSACTRRRGRPCCTPSRCSPARTRPACSISSPKVSSRGPRVCERATTATRSRSSSRPTRCSA